MEKEEKYLKDIVNEVIEERPEVLLNIQRGVASSIDILVNEIMRRTRVKVDPRKVRSLVLSKCR